MFVAGHLFSCVIWGFVIASILSVLLYLFGKSLLSRNSSVPAIIIVILAFILLFWQGVRLVGSLYLKGYVTDFTEVAADITQTGTDYLNTIDSVVELDNFKQQASTEYPLLSTYINQIELSDLDGQGVIEAIASPINKKLNSYIGARIGWMLGIVLVALVAIYLFYANVRAKTKSYSRRRSYEWDD